MQQLNLFPTQIKQACLIASSPKNAFYNLWLEELNGEYRIRKESGAGKNVLDKRLWRFESLEKAEKVFKQRVRVKINPDRKSPRKYKILA